jgi:hypothetical protein
MLEGHPLRQKELLAMHLLGGKEKRMAHHWMLILYLIAESAFLFHVEGGLSISWVSN